jgi:hypothetical protein
MFLRINCYSQEFNSILDEGDKQIEIVYARRYECELMSGRLKNAKKYKKKTRDIKNVPENVMQMITRRKRLLKELAPVFDDLQRPIEKQLFGE